jgi:hypothetical protein
MAEPIPTLTAPLDIKVDTKTAAAPVAPVAPAPVAAAPVVDNKTTPAAEVKPDVKAEVKPAEELKSLLDEAGEEEVKVAEAKVVPDKYSFKLPEGMTLDEATNKIVEPLFKELGLDNDQAQKLVDAQFALTKANEDAHVKAWEEFCENQKTEAKTYFGTKLPEVMKNVARARDTFIPKDASGKSALQDKLNAAGFSNDKDFLEFMDRVGRIIGEGKFVQGKQSSPARGMAGVETPIGKEATLADVYPSMIKK